MAEIQTLVIDRMDLLRRPRWDPDKPEQAPKYLQMVNAYARVLGSYSTEVLRSGMDLWEANWIKATWPMPAELAPYMNQAKADLKPPVQQIEDRSDEPRERTPDEVAAYREETKRIVAKIKDKLGWLDKYPEPRGAFSKPIKPRYVDMPPEARRKLVPDEEMER
ncbi:MAG: hypothetical protein ACR2QC_04155 [Gammaproteobacteria bacterium]